MFHELCLQKSCFARQLWDCVFTRGGIIIRGIQVCGVHSKQEFLSASNSKLLSTVHLPFLHCALCIHQCAYAFSPVCIHLSAPPEYISLLVCWPPTTSPYQQSSSFADAPNSQSNVGSLQQVSQIIRNQTNRQTSGAHIRIWSTTKALAVPVNRISKRGSNFCLFPGRR